MRKGHRGRSVAELNVKREIATDSDFRPLYLGPFISYGDRFALAPLLVSISVDLNESLAAVTRVATIYFLLYGALQPVWGFLSDRYGRVRIMRVALIGMGSANIAAGFAPDLTSLVIGKAITAAFAAAILPTSLVYVADKVVFAHRQRVIANVLAAGAVGTVTALFAAGFLSKFATWRLTFILFAVLGLVLSARVGRLPESIGESPEAGPLTHARLVLGRPWAVFLILLAIAEGAVMLGFLTFLAPALEATGQSSAVAGVVVATYGVAVFVGMQLVKRLLAVTGASASLLISVGGGLLLIAYLVASLDQQVLNVLVASVLIGLAFAFLHSTLQTWATEVAPEARGTAVSFFVTCVFTGAALGTAAVGGLAGRQDYDRLFLIAAGLSAPLVVVAAVSRARYGRATLGSDGSPPPP